jgi:hypothetical protein
MKATQSSRSSRSPEERSALSVFLSKVDWSVESLIFGLTLAFPGKRSTPSEKSEGVLLSLGDVPPPAPRDFLSSFHLLLCLFYDDLMVGAEIDLESIGAMGFITCRSYEGGLGVLFCDTWDGSM